MEALALGLALRPDLAEGITVEATKSPLISKVTFEGKRLNLSLSEPGCNPRKPITDPADAVTARTVTMPGAELKEELEAKSEKLIKLRAKLEENAEKLHEFREELDVNAERFRKLRRKGKGSA